MRLLILLVLLPFFCNGQHYENVKVTIQTQVTKESKLVPVKYKNKTLLIDRNVAIQLKLKSGQQINTSEDFYWILAYNTRFWVELHKTKKE